MAARRRGNGEGGIYQRADGMWCASVDLGIVNGKRRRKVIYGKTRKEVSEKLKTLHREQAAGNPISVERQTVAEFLEHWLTTVVAQRNKPRTQESYREMVRLHIEPQIGRHQLSKLAPEHVQAMLTTLLEKGLSPRTAQYARAILRRALDQAVRWGRIGRNVAALVDGPRVEKHVITPLSEAQARSLLVAVKGHRLEALYRVALSLGLRRGEILGLRWQDVDFERQTLRVSVALQGRGQNKHLASPKTASSVRLLALPPVLLAVLEQHRRNQEEERTVVGADWDEHDLVFPSNRGTPMEGSNLLKHFKATLQRANLPAIRFHDLRHSCATLLIAQGVHPRVIMEILGHSKISTTMDIYAHVLPETQRDAMKKLDQLFGEEDTEDEGFS